MRFLLSLFLLLSFPGDTPWKLTLEVKGKNFIDMAPDQFGNILVIEGDNLLKLDEKGKVQATFSNPSLGSPTEINALDALNPLLFYREANVLITLDNRLNESVRTNFLEEGFYDVTLVCPSDEERVWLYDQAQDKLFRYNLIQGKIEGRSLNITQLSGSENKPIQLVSTFEHTYVNVPEVGILSFTATGAFEKVIPFKEVAYFDVDRHTLYLLKNNGIERFEMKTKAIEKLILSDVPGGIERIKIRGERLYTQGEKRLGVYQH